jgi:hypothetical protein
MPLLTSTSSYGVYYSVLIRLDYLMGEIAAAKTDLPQDSQFSSFHRIIKGAAHARSPSKLPPLYPLPQKSRMATVSETVAGASKNGNDLEFNTVDNIDASQLLQLLELDSTLLPVVKGAIRRLVKASTGTVEDATNEAAGKGVHEL